MILAVAEAADIMMMDIGARTFASKPLDKEAVLARYRAYPPDLPAAATSLVHLCLQYSENAAIKVKTGDPWTMYGRLVREDETRYYVASGLHRALFHVYRLRLAVFYDADVATLRSIVADAEPHEANIMGMSFGSEWVFLRNTVEVLSGSPAKDDLLILKACKQCTSTAAPLGRD